MFVPVRPESLESHGPPLATFGLITLWLVLLLASTLGVPAISWADWGLVPGDFDPLTLPTHVFLSASWPQWIGSSLLLLCVGPALELRWGRTFYVGFVLITAMLAGGSYVLLSPGLGRPLVGPSGGLAAVVGAAAFLHWRTGLHYTPLFRLPTLPSSVRLPAFALAPLWMVCEIIMSFGDHPIGMTRGTAYWSQLTGLALGIACAFALRRWNLEEGLPGAYIDVAERPTNHLVKAMAALSAGRHELAFDLLEQAARAHPEDPDVITNLWETACACDRVQRAAPLVLLFVQQQITSGDEAVAVNLWCELVHKAPKLQAHPRALVELASALKREKRVREAAWTLRCAAQQRALLPGAALRIASLAKGIHPSTGIAAARRALETPGLDQSKREHIEGLLRELDEERRASPEIDLDTAPDRSIAIELDDSFAPPPQHAKALAQAEANATSGFQLSADGSLEEDAAGVDLAADPSLPATELTSPDMGFAAPLANATPLTAAPAGSPNARTPAAALSAPPPSAAALPRATAPRPAAPTAAPATAARPVPSPPAAPRAPAVDAIAFDTIAGEARFQSLKLIEVVPLAMDEQRIELAQAGGKRAAIAYSQVQAVGVGAVHGLSDKPVILIDLLLNWNNPAGGPLQVLRVRSDRFDVRRLAPQASRPMDAIRSLLAALLERSGAVPLPDAAAARGNPVRIFADLASYQREVLQVVE
jgi:membrane associated rhomboid family serine protease